MFITMRPIISSSIHQKTPPPIGEAGSRGKAGLSLNRFPFDGYPVFPFVSCQKLYRMPPLI